MQPHRKNDNINQPGPQDFPETNPPTKEFTWNKPWPCWGEDILGLVKALFPNVGELPGQRSRSGWVGGWVTTLIEAGGGKMGLRVCRGEIGKGISFEM